MDVFTVDDDSKRSNYWDDVYIWIRIGSRDSHYQSSRPLSSRIFCLPVLGFKLLATTLTTLLASLVIATIKATRSLYKPHSIFIANLMVADMMLVLMGCLISTVMIAGFAVGKEDLIDCNLFWFLYVPGLVVSSSYVIISGDMVITIAFPFKYKQAMTPRVIAGMIIVAWILAIIPFVPMLVHGVLTGILILHSMAPALPLVML